MHVCMYSHHQGWVELIDKTASGSFHRRISGSLIILCLASAQSPCAADIIGYLGQYVPAESYHSLREDTTIGTWNLELGGHEFSRKEKREEKEKNVWNSHELLVIPGTDWIIRLLRSPHHHQEKVQQRHVPGPPAWLCDQTVIGRYLTRLELGNERDRSRPSARGMAGEELFPRLP